MLRRGDNQAAVSWVTRCGGARDKRTCLPIRMLGLPEIAGGWNHSAKHIPGVQNTPVDGISRWPRSFMTDKIIEMTNSSGWYEPPIETRGSGIVDIVLQTKNMRSKHDDLLWNFMMNEADHG